LNLFWLIDLLPEDFLLEIAAAPSLRLRGIADETSLGRKGGIPQGWGSLVRGDSWKNNPRKGEPALKDGPVLKIVYLLAAV
jgi:hypothetical protein